MAKTRNKVGKKGKVDKADLWGAHDEVENPEVDLGRPDRVDGFKRYYAPFALYGTPILAGLFALSALAANSNSQVVQDDIQTLKDRQTNLSVTSPGKAAAQDALNKWLVQKPNPLPGGEVLSWEGAKDVPYVPVKDANGNVKNAKPAFTSELDSFVVRDANDNHYTASVQVLTDPRGGTSVQGTPSLIPIRGPIQDGWIDGAPWPGYAPGAEVSDSVRTVVSGWANAFVSGAPSQLSAAVGDSNSSHTYVPLTGISNVTATVQTAADKNGDGKTLIAQVSLVPQWSGQPVPSDKAGSVEANARALTYDVLIEQANTSAPVVKAWGAPGSGPTLSPYANAVAAVAGQDGSNSTDAVTPRDSSSASSSATPAKK